MVGNDICLGSYAYIVLGNIVVLLSSDIKYYETLELCRCTINKLFLLLLSQNVQKVFCFCKTQPIMCLYNEVLIKQIKGLYYTVYTVKKWHCLWAVSNVCPDFIIVFFSLEFCC